jgi:hypothetical protein
MVLHPGMKLDYFRQAEGLVRDEYMSSYHNKVVPVQEPSAITTNHGNDFTDFGNLSVTTAPRQNELDDYLCLVVKNVNNPLVWWHNNQFVYLNLHHMALDYLSAPATSTAVEWVFSQGRILLHHTRNRLLASTIRAHLCVGSWCQNDLISMHDITLILKEALRKRKRSVDETEMGKDKSDVVVVEWFCMLSCCPPPYAIYPRVPSGDDGTPRFIPTPRVQTEGYWDPTPFSAGLTGSCLG